MGGGSAQKPTRFGTLDFQTSQLGAPIPILWGRNKISFNVLWTGPLHSKKLGKMSGKGGGKTTAYKYSCALILGLAEGPLGGVLRSWVTGQEYDSLSYLNLELITGTESQSAPAWITANYPDQAVSYARTAYIYTQGYNLGETPTMPDISFEADGFRSGSCAFGGNTLPDANPADILSDFVTANQYGLDPGATYIDATSLALYKSYCQSQGIWFSPYLRSTEQATSIIQRWAQLSNTWIFYSGIKLKTVPLGVQSLSNFGATYTPVLTPLYDLGPADFTVAQPGDCPVMVTRIDPMDGYNRVEIDCKNRNAGAPLVQTSSRYASDPVQWNDMVSEDTYGQLQSLTVSADEICEPVIGARIATLIGQRSTYIRNNYEFSTDGRFILLEPGDIVTLTDPGLRLVRMPVRITDVSEDDKWVLKFKAEECPTSLGVLTDPTPQTNQAAPAATMTNAPGSVNQPLIFEPSAAMTGGQPEIWVGASGGTDWGSADVYLSTDGTNYALVGSLPGPLAQGVLTAALPSTPDPDTTDTLAIDLTESVGLITSATTDANADKFLTASMVDTELLAYGTVNQTGTYTYGLTYLRRGIYSTTIAAHASGAQFWRVDPSSVLVIPLQQQFVGTTLHFKFCSSNTYGAETQDISTVTDYTYTPAGVSFAAGSGSTATIAPATPAGLAATAVAGGFSLAWMASADGTISQYRIYAAPGSGASFLSAMLVGAAPAPTAVAVVYGQASGAAETVFLVAVNGAGASAPTAGVNVTPL